MLNLIVLCGRTGSNVEGLLSDLKDTEADFHFCKRSTTLAVEVDSDEYEHIDTSDYVNGLLSGDLICAKAYDDHAEGLLLKNLEPNCFNIMIATPTEIDQLEQEADVGLNISVIYLDMSLAQSLVAQLVYKSDSTADEVHEIYLKSQSERNYEEVPNTTLPIKVINGNLCSDEVYVQSLDYIHWAV